MTNEVKRFNPCETEECKRTCDSYVVRCEDICIEEIERLRVIEAAALNLCRAKETYIAAGYGCLALDGTIEFTAPVASMCHEHINNGINDFGLVEMAKLKVVQIYYKLDA